MPIQFCCAVHKIASKDYRGCGAPQSPENEFVEVFRISTASMQDLVKPLHFAVLSLKDLVDLLQKAIKALGVQHPWKKCCVVCFRAVQP